LRYIIYPEAFRRETLGAKGAALAELQCAGFSVPIWFALSPAAFYASVDRTAFQRWETSAEPTVLASLLHNLVLPVEIQNELHDALRRLSPNGERLAVRSSAQDEDGMSHSFAGQLDSFLCVPPAQAADKIVEVWRSAFSERILAYRGAHGLSATPRAPAVLIQRMVDADVAGVAFDADPVSGRRDVAIVSALHGLGTAVVSGESDADTYHVNRQGCITRRDLAGRRVIHGCAPGAPASIGSIEPTHRDGNLPALTEDQVRAIATLVRRAGHHFSRPQDVEWAIEDGILYLLQSRPITALAGKGDPDGMVNLWDNSNITESYSGVTTPLTFSFARRAYEGVYREFCKIMGVSPSTVSANVDTFRRMIGLIRGRIYYNLASWYRVLALLPGFSTNRRFMEQMMGVKEGIPQTLLAEIAPPSGFQRLKDHFAMLRTLLALMTNHFLIGGKIRRFNQRLEQALALPKLPLEEMRADELAAYYRDLERQLLSRWDAPILNDFFAMVFSGLLRKMTEKWCDATAGALQSSLLCGQDGLISTKPARRIETMARLASRQGDLVELLSEGSIERILARIQRLPVFKQSYEEYLALFGERCLGELKLESHTLNDDPLPLLRSIGRLARQLEAPTAQNSSNAPPSLHQSAPQQTADVLAHQPMKRRILQWVLKNTRARLRDRENLRFSRTRVFGRTRRIFTEIGKRLYALDLLQDPRDIFYLEVDEILGFIEGTSTSTNLRGLAELRKSEFALYESSAAPEDRFETCGTVHHGNDFQRRIPTHAPTGNNLWQGIGCSPGIARGEVRVVADPRNADLHGGEIIVAERTDPAWVMLFTAAAGLLVERGSLLSHSAIVAREMGIPAIVSLSGITHQLRDGEQVELNGTSGCVRRLDPLDIEARHVS